MNTDTNHTQNPHTNQDPDTTREGQPHWRPAILSSPTDADRLMCGLCPHGCSLRPGQIGLCRVRRNHKGQLQTATFAVGAAHLDPIERKPLYHVRPGSAVLTLAAPGCTFRCDYCVNHRLSQYGRDASSPWRADEARPAELVAAAAAQSAAIGLSYTEPGLAPELTLALAEHAKPAGVPVVWKTNGFLTAAAIDLIAPALYAVNIDIKAAGDQAHRRLTGAPLGPVLDAIERFRAAGVWVEVSTPLIPGTASDACDLRVIAGRIAAVDPDIPWHLVRFTPDYRMHQHVPTLPSELDAARMIGRDAGLRFVYVERALGAAGRSTLCPDCDTVLVSRGVWKTMKITITDGRCPRCGRSVPRSVGVIMDADPRFGFVASLPDLIDAAEYADHPGGIFVRLRIEVSDTGVVLLGDAMRPVILEALLAQISSGTIEEMLCG